MNRKKIRKGDFGYRRKAKQGRIMTIVLLFIGILILLAMRSVVGAGLLRLLMTISAILIVIPIGMIASPLLASWKYNTPDVSFYDQVHPYEERFEILYDLIVTTKEQVIPLDAVIVHPIGMFAYCSDQKLDYKKAESGLNDIFAMTKPEPKIHIMNELKSFERRLESLKPSSEYEDDGVVDIEEQVLKSLCM